MYENNTRRFTVYERIEKERDERATELKRRLSLARASRNKPEIRRIEKQLKFWGIPA